MKKNNYTIPSISKIISIDAATRSLAISRISIKNKAYISKSLFDILNELNIESLPMSSPHNKYYSQILQKISAALTWIDIHDLTVIDLLPNKKINQSTPIERSAALYSFMHKYTEPLAQSNWLDTNTIILIEYQMSPNKQSNAIKTQLIYHFLKYVPASNIHIVRPTIKNKLTFLYAPNEATHQAFTSQYTSYTANKLHTKYLFLKWIDAHNYKHMISHISKKNYSDIADAFCQAIAWHMIHSF